MKQKTHYLLQLVVISLILIIFAQETYSQEKDLQFFQKKVKYYVKAYILIKPISTPVSIGVDDIKEYPSLVMKSQTVSNQKKIKKLIRQMRKLVINKNGISGFCKSLEVYKQGKLEFKIGITWDNKIWINGKSYIYSKRFLETIEDMLK